MENEMEITFGDLTDEAAARYLELNGVSDIHELNQDTDTVIAWATVSPETNSD